jgi:hypothetical protein
MAINPELITTIRVDQLPDGTLNLTNKIPHTSGTVLEKASVQELVDLVATAIGVSGGVGYIAISVTDGQQLPDVPELPSFFLCGAGTFLNINGYPDIICTENLNAIMSLTDHWELAVEIPINPLSGTVQSVTGSAVDNTDPLNPVINEIIYGVQNIVAGTNITVDNTDPANPIVSATSGGTTPTLQEVLDNNHDLVDGNNFQGSAAGDNNTGIFVNALGQDAANTNTGTQVNALGTEAANQNEGDNVNALGNVAAGFNTGNNVNALGDNAGNNNTGNAINALGNAAGVDNTGNAVNALGQETAYENIGNDVNALGFRAGVNNTFNNVNLFGETAQADENGQTVLSKDGTIMARISTTDLTATRKYNLPNASGTLALTSDIPSSSGIPHATASGTDTYTATITGVAAYSDADAYLIRFTNGNTTGATLNINSLGAKTLYRNNDGALIGGDIINGGEMLCIYNTSLNGFQVIGTAPNSLFAYVTNDDSVTLTKGMPVYAFSGTGDRMTVKRANNSTDATSAQTVGLVLSTSIAANQKGLIMMQGLLDGLSILPTATFADGDAVYLGATDGSITNVKPYAPNHLVYLGVVTTASNGSSGRMYVRVQNGYELSEIHDVDLISNAPTNNQALVYETSTDLWKNKTIIEDSITNGVTTIAPSQNAVFDALALKQNVVSGVSDTEIGYLDGVTSAIQTQLNTKCQSIYNLTSQVTHTGTTAKTIILSFLIPANTFTDGDFLNFSAIVAKTSVTSTTHNLEINTTNTLTGATTIAIAGFSSTNATMKFKREIVLSGGSAYVLNVSTGTPNDSIVGVNVTPLNQYTYNLAADLYFFITCTLTNTTDSITYRGVSVTKN